MTVPWNVLCSHLADTSIYKLFTVISKTTHYSLFKGSKKSEIIASIMVLIVLLSFP